jgi:hypothetical protein
MYERQQKLFKLQCRDYPALTTVTILEIKVSTMHVFPYITQFLTSEHTACEAKFHTLSLNTSPFLSLTVNKFPMFIRYA